MTISIDAIDHDVLEEIHSGGDGFQVDASGLIGLRAVALAIAMADKHSICADDRGILIAGIDRSNVLALRVWIPCHAFDDYSCTTAGVTHFEDGAISAAFQMMETLGCSTIQLDRDCLTLESRKTHQAKVWTNGSVSKPGWPNVVDNMTAETWLHHRAFDAVAFDDTDGEHCELAALTDGRAILSTRPDDDELRNRSVSIADDIDVDPDVDEDQITLITYDYLDRLWGVNDGPYVVRWADGHPALFETTAGDIGLSFLVAPRLYRNNDEGDVYENADPHQTPEVSP